MDDIPSIIGILLGVVLGGAIVALIAKTIMDRINRKRIISHKPDSEKKDETEDKK